MLIKTGVPEAEDIKGVTPSAQRLAKGPVAIIECFQRIPCNPCFLSCKQGAIEEFKDINDLPRIDDGKCTGCGICIANCPGLAIFVVDNSYAEDLSLVKIPYEYLPVPEANALVAALDREGRKIGVARVVKVQRIKGQERTPVIWLAVPRDLVMSVRNIRVEGLK
jgi:Fe-S-cluster-containing hydrogenase component 2